MTTQIKEYSETEAALADLSTRLSVVPDYNTKDGYVEGEEGRKELKGYRIALDKKRKALGEEARKHLNLINSEAKPIREALEKLENPFVEAKKEADEAEERIKTEELRKEQERIDTIEADIKFIKNSVHCSRTVEAIIFSMVQLDKIDTADGYDEFEEAAALTKKMAMEELDDMLAEAKQQEADAKRVKEEAAQQAKKQKELDAQQAEIDAQKAKQEAELKTERDKIAKEKAEIERVKKEEADRVKAEKDAEAQKVADAKAEKKRKADEAKAKRETAKRIKADKTRFKKDSVAMIGFSEMLRDVLCDMSEYKGQCETETTDLLKAVTVELECAIELIAASPIVKSQEA